MHCGLVWQAGILTVFQGLLTVLYDAKQGAGKHTNLTNPTMHLSYIPKYTMKNRIMQIFVLNGMLWDMGPVHHGISEIGLLPVH